MERMVKEYAADGSWEPVWDRTKRWGVCNDCGKRFIFCFTELDAEVCEDCVDKEVEHATV